MHRILAVLALVSAVRPAAAAEGPDSGAPTPSGGSTVACRKRSSTRAAAWREFGVDAVWLGSGSLTPERLALLRAQEVRVFAEFNTLHVAELPEGAPRRGAGRAGRARLAAPARLAGHLPDARGLPPEPDGGIPAAAREYEVDGVWLDYHHAHASWERAEPKLPDTCFCARCLGRFQKDTGVRCPDATTAEVPALLLATHRGGVGPLAVRRASRTGCGSSGRSSTRSRPAALLGTFHCPWTDEERGGARLDKLAIDLRAQAAYLDVFSPMPYHARFGHADDPAWISRQIAWLGRHLGVEGRPGERAPHLADRAALRLGRGGARSSRCRRCSTTARARPPRA